MTTVGKAVAMIAIGKIAVTGAGMTAMGMAAGTGKTGAMVAARTVVGLMATARQVTAIEA